MARQVGGPLRLAALQRAETLLDGKPGPCVLKAAIAGGRHFEDTARQRIARLHQ